MAIEFDVYTDQRVKPIVDKGGKRVIYRAIVSVGSETRVIWGAVREMINGRVEKTTPPFAEAWDRGEPV
jgi:hypothetical protein